MFLNCLLLLHMQLLSMCNQALWGERGEEGYMKADLESHAEFSKMDSIWGESFIF